MSFLNGYQTLLILFPNANNRCYSNGI